MRKIRTLVLVMILACLALLLMAGRADTAVPQAMNYQGRLTDSFGNGLDTTVAMVFSIYDAPAGGAVLWTETQPAVVVSGGTFNVLLGTVWELTGVVFADSVRYLGIRVGADPELVPRTRLVSVAYAFRVETVDGALGGTISGTLTIGPDHDNSGSNAFVAGAANKATGDFSVVGGGRHNHARGSYATVSGGGSSLLADSNAALGDWSTIGGGWRHLAGGQFSTIGGGDDQTATGDYSTISGGKDNGTLAENATVAGGRFNTVTAPSAVIGGGFQNAVTGAYAVIPGGFMNSADGAYSFAAGRAATVRPEHPGSFVFADSTALPFSTAAANEFAVRATGGARIVTAVDGLGQPTAGVCVTAGSGSWSSCSDRNLKENIRPADGAAILERLAGLPISEWNYRSQDRTIRHVGPMAQDFHAAFGVGDDARYITAVDADGIALAAIQELQRQMAGALRTRDQEVRRLRTELDEVRRLLNRALVVIQAEERQVIGDETECVSGNVR